MSNLFKGSILSLLSFLSIGFCPSARAERLVTVELETDYTYQDADFACHKSDRFSLFFAGRVENGVVVQGRFHQGQFKSFPKAIDFTAEELKGVEIVADSVGDYWVKKLPVSARVLNWLIFNIAGIELNGPGVCRPKKALKTMAPYGHTYVFTQKSASEFTTGKARFAGERVDGEPYNVKLGIKQRPVK